MISKLSDYCYFADGRVAVTDLDLDSYISTENMLPNKGGITRSAGLPTVTQTQAYQVDDVLVSNIRPYFRKIWFADRNGGCSNDVLVLRAKDTCNPSFLYYLLSDNNFFDYATATSKGTKMPRGDKGAIMRYAVPDMSLDTQIEIAYTLSALDARIAENGKINHHLAAWTLRTAYCLFHDRDGFRHMQSLVVKAQTPGSELLPQISGFFWRQPKVCVSESCSWSEATNEIFKSLFTECLLKRDFAGHQLWQQRVS